MLYGAVALNDANAPSVQKFPRPIIHKFHSFSYCVPFLSEQNDRKKKKERTSGVPYARTRRPAAPSTSKKKHNSINTISLAMISV